MPSYLQRLNKLDLKALKERRDSNLSPTFSFRFLRTELKVPQVNTGPTSHIYTKGTTHVQRYLCDMCEVIPATSGSSLWSNESRAFKSVNIMKSTPAGRKLTNFWSSELSSTSPRIPVSQCLHLRLPIAVFPANGHWEVYDMPYFRHCLLQDGFSFASFFFLIFT